MGLPIFCLRCSTFFSVQSISSVTSSTFRYSCSSPRVGQLSSHLNFQALFWPGFYSYWALTLLRALEALYKTMTLSKSPFLLYPGCIFFSPKNLFISTGMTATSLTVLCSGLGIPSFDHCSVQMAI